jgi:hypothetical protein
MKFSGPAPQLFETERRCIWPGNFSWSLGDGGIDGANPQRTLRVLLSDDEPAEPGDAPGGGGT